MEEKVEWGPPWMSVFQVGGPGPVDPVNTQVLFVCLFVRSFWAGLFVFFRIVI